MIKDKLKKNFEKLLIASQKLNKKGNSRKSSKAIVNPFCLKVGTSTLMVQANTLFQSVKRLKESLNINPDSSQKITKSCHSIQHIDTLAAITTKNNSLKMKKKNNKKAETIYMDFDFIVRQLKKKKLKPPIDENKTDSPPVSASRKRTKNMSMKSTILLNSNDLNRTPKSRVQTIKIEPLLQPIKENEETNTATLPNNLISLNGDKESTERNNSENQKLLDDEKFQRKKARLSSFSPLYPNLKLESSDKKTSKINSPSIFTLDYPDLKNESPAKLLKKSQSLHNEGEDAKRKTMKNSFENFLIETKEFRDESIDPSSA